jgi:hypothetical protein
MTSTALPITISTSFTTSSVNEIVCQSDYYGIKSMKKVYAYLNGGLGNQMFQYATARALALRTGSELVLDSWSGFVRDYQYQRSYELHYLPIQARLATALERTPIWLFRVENRVRGVNPNVFQHRIYGNFLVETETRFIEEIIHFRQANVAWLVGYWQSPHYFQYYESIIRAELTPLQPTQKQFLDLGRTMRDTESVAIGIRLYEESVDPAAHAKGRLMKGMADVNTAIARLQALQPNAQFFVFCTHRSQSLAELDLPDSTVFVTYDDGYEGTIESLWLMTQCKHHIFMNSSFYWWGAWLSAGLYSTADDHKHIYAADNFTNQDGLCSTWEKF